MCPGEPEAASQAGVYCRVVCRGSGGWVVALHVVVVVVVGVVIVCLCLSVSLFRLMLNVL